MNEIFSPILIGIGLSMDAFSLAILYGTLNIGKKKINALSIIVGIFHFFMPILGYFLGSMVLSYIMLNAHILVGTIFLIIAIEMLISLFKNEEVPILSNPFSLFLFGFTVSIDSFSVGIGLASLNKPLYLYAIIFSIISFLFTYTGLRLGGKISERFGKYGTLLGSMILLFLAIYHYLQ